MNKITAIIFFSTVLFGCTTTKTVTEYKEVKVPIAIPCAVDVPNRPEFFFVQLKDEEDIFVKVKALLADRKLYEGYTNELLKLLDLCRK